MPPHGLALQGSVGVATGVAEGIGVTPPATQVQFPDTTSQVPKRQGGPLQISPGGQDGQLTQLPPHGAFAHCGVGVGTGGGDGVGVVDAAISHAPVSWLHVKGGSR